jgi:hypothetical protein
MKKILILYLLCMIGCTNDGDPSQNDELQNIDKALEIGMMVCKKNVLPWLSELLEKAEEDRLTKKHMGQYMGFVSVVSYKNQSYFYVTFPMGSGGIFAYLFDCEGKQVSSLLTEASEYFYEAAHKRNAMIYSTVDFY